MKTWLGVAAAGVIAVWSVSITLAGTAFPAHQVVPDSWVVQTASDGPHRQAPALPVASRR